MKFDDAVVILAIERRQLALDLRVHVALFAQLAQGGARRRFTGIKLATWKLPMASEMHVVVATGDEPAVMLADYGDGNLEAGFGHDDNRL